MDKRNSFVIYIDSLDVLDQLDDSQAGKLFKAIKAYQKGEEIDLDPMTKILFPFFKNYFDRNKEKYVAESEHRSESGFMGNLKRWHHDLFVKVTANQMTREQAQVEVNLRKLSLPDSTQSTPIANVATVADSESVIESEPVIEIKYISPIFKLDTEQFLEDQITPQGIIEETPKPLPPKKEKPKFTPPTLDEVKNYFIEKGYKVEAAVKAFNYYAAGNWKDSNGRPVKNWQQKMNGVWFKDENKVTAHSPQGTINPADLIPNPEQYLGYSKFYHEHKDYRNVFENETWNYSRMV